MMKHKKVEARSPKHSESSPDDELKQLFQIFDKDGNGEISAKEIRATMRELGMTLTDDDVAEMMKEAGVKPTGKLTIDGLY